MNTAGTWGAPGAALYPRVACCRSDGGCVRQWDEEESEADEGSSGMSTEEGMREKWCAVRQVEERE